MQNSLSENKAPVKTSQTVLLKEAVTLEKNFACVVFWECRKHLQEVWFAE